MNFRIFLIGFMGSGKSTIGSALAREIGYDFVDMDHLIEDTAGMTVPGIFRELGEEVFRKWEHDILMELCDRQHMVVSTGGGAPCHNQMMKTMNEHGETIYIYLPPEILKERLIHSKTERPLISGKTEPELLKFITDLLEEREYFYKQAKFTINGINLRVGDIVNYLKNK